MQKNTRALVGQFLIGLAVATLTGTIIAPAGSHTFRPDIAVAGAISALVLMGIAVACNERQ